MQLPAKLVFDLRVAFSRELATMVPGAREALQLLLTEPNNERALKQISSLFHLTCGTAGTLGFPLVSRTSAICERFLMYVQDGSIPFSRRIAQVINDGFTVIETMAIPMPVSDSADPKGHEGGAGIVVSASGEIDQSVFVIDDDPVAAALVSDTLRLAGFHSTYCTEPDQAVARARDGQPALIILESMMPTADGLELCRDLRKEATLGLTPILLITQDSGAEPRKAALLAGGSDSITKPFLAKDLVARAHLHLRRLAALRELKVRDSLTRSFNRTYLTQRIQEELEGASESGSPFTLALVDLDDFRKITESLGHSAGNQILVEVAAILAASVRGSDLVGRWGLDEFAVLMPDSSPEEAETIGRRFLERLASQPMRVDPIESENESQEVAVSASIGIVPCKPGDDFEGIERRAIETLQRATQNGDDNIEIADG